MYQVPFGKPGIAFRDRKITASLKQVAEPASDDESDTFRDRNEAVYIELVSKSEGKSLLHFSSLLRDN